MNNREETILALKGLEVGYRKEGKGRGSLLPPLDAEIKCGEMVSVIGQNGVGKSTLLKTIAGLLAPVSGSVFAKGTDVSLQPRHDLARHIGYISTEQLRVSSMRVIDLVRLGRYPYTDWTGRLSATDSRIVDE